MHTTAKLIRIVIITAIVVAAGMLVLWRIAENTPLLPDRAPVNVEENAVINNEAEEKMDTPSGGGGASLSYAKEITIDLAAGLATLCILKIRGNLPMTLLFSSLFRIR